MFFSSIKLKRNISPKDALFLRGGSNYQIHQMIWKLFSDSPKRKRDYIYRHQSTQGWPDFHTVSSRKPTDDTSCWEIETKEYNPKLVKNEQLYFSLRANPTTLKKKERTEEEIKIWTKNRLASGLCQKDPTKKRVRHDIVMSAKKELDLKIQSSDERPNLADIVQDTGLEWLALHEKRFGFEIDKSQDKSAIRVDGYLQHKLYKGGGKHPIQYSTLDFNGLLTITDPELFINECLYKGIGSAKGFGCGLMMVKRI